MWIDEKAAIQSVLEDYYQWLIGLLGDDDLRENYQKLMKKLFDTEFRWTVSFDSNRAGDGLYLREVFTKETGIELYFDAPCSVLEMMIALAMRCEDLIYDPDVSDSVLLTFMDMLYNLELDLMDDNYYDEEEVDEILCCFMDRKYDFNGHGGLFCVLFAPEDFRKKDIWWQANVYLDEKYG